MATVSEPVVTEPITMDAACQTTCPSIEEEVQEVASALDLCVKKHDFDTDSDTAIESGEEGSNIDVWSQFLSLLNSWSVVKEILTECVLSDFNCYISIIVSCHFDAI